MCGRFTLRLPPQALAEFLDMLYELESLREWKPRFNIAPTTQVLCVRETAQQGREFFHAKWGLIPSWSKDEKIGVSCINARAESLHTKPAFRSAFQQRRCLVVASGFYEWQKVGSQDKQPHYITLKSGDPLLFAGLWERWQPTPQSPAIESCTICTTSANTFMQSFHERMPVILPRGMAAPWLDPTNDEPDTIKPLLAQFPAEEMQAWPVSPRVNSVRNDDPSLTQPVRPPASLFHE